MQNEKNYTYQEKIYRKPLFYICIIISMIAMFLTYKSCNSDLPKAGTVSDTLTTKNTQHGKNINKLDSSIKKRGVIINAEKQVIYIEKLRYITKYKEIIKESPDTCNQYLIELYNACNLLDSAKSVHIERQDSVISEYKQINGLYKLITHNDTVRINQLLDSVPKVKRKGFISGFKWGFGTGVIVTEVVNLGSSLLK